MKSSERGQQENVQKRSDRKTVPKCIKTLIGMSCQQHIPWVRAYSCDMYDEEKLSKETALAQFSMDRKHVSFVMIKTFANLQPQASTAVSYVTVQLSKQKACSHPQPRLLFVT